MDRLVLIHASDIHLGPVPVGGNLHAHDPRVLEAFYNALAALDLDPEDFVVLIVTGDLSARGDDSELNFYEALRDVGLSKRKPFVRALEPWAEFVDQVFEIPGNHDYWNGQILNPVVHQPTRTQRWPGLPKVFEHDLGGYRIAVHGVCSTFGASRLQQLFAVGCISASDVVALRAQIDWSTRRARAHGREPLTILALHHSSLDGDDACHGLCSTTVRELAALHKLQGIRALLTGHLHSQRAGCRTPDLPHEVRCSSTFVRPILKRRKVPGFVVHKLAPGKRRLDWEWDGWDYVGSRFKKLKTSYVP